MLSANHIQNKLLNVPRKCKTTDSKDCLIMQCYSAKAVRCWQCARMQPNTIEEMNERCSKVKTDNL